MPSSFQINAHRILNMSETVAAKVLAAKPACHHNDLASDIFAFQHAQDDHARPCFTVVILNRTIRRDQAPGVMRCFGKLFLALQLSNKVFGLCLVLARAARDRVLRSPITDNVLENLHDRLVNPHNDFTRGLACA